MVGGYGRAALALAVALVSVACAAPDSLSVQLVSNYSTVTEIDGAHVVVTRDGATLLDARVALASDASLGRPRRLADATLGAGPVAVTVELTWRGAVVATRHVARDVIGRTSTTVLMTRDCAGVACPSASEPAALECLGGRCVAPECDEEHPELCASPECRVDADCTLASASCAPATCTASGSCIALPDDTRCAAGQVCDPGRGCIGGGTTCTLGAWGTPVVLTVLDSTSAEFSPEPSSDGLRLYFDSGRSGNQDIYVAERPARDAPFGAPVIVAELSSGSEETDPSLTDDERDLFFTSNRGGVLCLYEAQRSSRDAAFGPAVRQSALCAATPISGAHVSDDGLRLYYNTVQDSFIEGTLMVATRTSRDVAFTSAVPVGGLAAGHVGFPWLSPDELTIYFETSEPGHLQAMVARRSSTSVPFAAAVAVPELAAVRAGDLALSADGTELFFSNTLGDIDLEVTTRRCE